MSQHVPLSVSTRTEFGSAKTRRLRKAGRLPGVLYQPGGDSLPFLADEYEVVVLDKGRGVGGRMATRRIGEATLDHGAQFFTTHTAEFASVVAGWVAAGVAVPWFAGRVGPHGVASWPTQLHTPPAACHGGGVPSNPSAGSVLATSTRPSTGRPTPGISAGSSAAL